MAEPGFASVNSAMLTLLFTMWLSSATSQQLTAQANRTVGAARTWRVLWRDEFAGRNGKLNPRKWSFELGEGCQYLSDMQKMCGWGNGELQYYTPLQSNARVEDGNLIIEARREENGLITSARIRTLGHFSVKPNPKFKTIRVEARILLPAGTGLWPAFWMLPSFDSTCMGCGRLGRWAASGELDIMEAANDMEELHGTIHFGGSWPDNKYLTAVTGPSDGTPFAGNWHTYSVEWEKEEIRWYVDRTLYSTLVSSRGSTSGGGWFSMAEGAGADSPFDQPFHIIINMAVGGQFSGQPSYDQVAATLHKPKRMLIDYVRVYGWQ